MNRRARVGAAAGVLLLCAGAIAAGETAPLLVDLARRVRSETRIVDGRARAHYFASQAEVVVDGDLGEWAASDVIALDQLKDATSSAPGPLDFSGFAMVAWSPAHPSRLCLAAALVDDTLEDSHPSDTGWFNDDCLEFLVDFRNEAQKGAALQHGIGAGGRDLSGALSPANTTFSVKREGAVTVIEAAVDYALDNPYRPGAGVDFRAREGRTIGFSIGYDDGEAGVRQAQMGWTAGKTWEPANWGYLVFAGAAGPPAEVSYGAPASRTLPPPPAPPPLSAGTPLAKGALYVSPGGDDAAPGTASAPLASLGAAVRRAAPGSTIYLSGGLYRIAGTILLGTGGSPDSPTCISALPGEVPILDFADGGIGGERRGIVVSGDWWLLRAIVVQNAGDNGVLILGSHNTVERVVTRGNQDSGLQIHRGASHNLVLDCDSYYNYDAANHGENADGFAAKFELGEGNLLRGCRAWNNADDGFDLWQAAFPVTLEGCFAFENGLNFWSDGGFEGDGNGFKLGQEGGAHLIVRCVAAGNRQHGFDVNGNTSGVTVLHCAAHANGGAGFHFDDERPHRLANNLSYVDRVVVYPGVRAEANSWSLAGGAPGDLRSTDFESIDLEPLRSPRTASGSLPAVAFLRPVSASMLVDAGVDVGLPYAGRGPDVGAWEVR